MTDYQLLRRVGEIMVEAARDNGGSLTAAHLEELFGKPQPSYTEEK